MNKRTFIIISIVQQVGGEVEAPAEVQTGDMGVAWRRQGMCGEGGEERQRLRQQELSFSRFGVLMLEPI